MRIRTLNFLPEIFQTPTNRQFLAATLDQLVNPPVKQTIQGYIGNKFGNGINANDYYVTEPTKIRTDYQLDPGVVFTNTNESTARDFISYPGIIDALKEQLGETADNNRLFNSQFYSWDSFVNLDKLINYNEYYWLPEGLPAVIVGTSTVYLEEDYAVTDNANTYSISPIDAPIVNDNPILTLLRGGTYTFAVDQGTQFWIQGEPGTSGYSLTNPNQYVRNIYGITNNGATAGTVTFNVPQITAQDAYQFLGNNTIDLVTSLTYSQINGVLLSTLGNIDGVVSLENLTLMFYNGTVQTNFYTITYTGDPNNPTISLILGDGIPTNEKITALSGDSYSGLQFYRDSLGNVTEIPYLSSLLDTLYYQDNSSPTKVGVIRIIDDSNSATINVETQILGKTEYTSPNGVVFTNGLKVTFQGDVYPLSYLNNEYYVEGVGSAIELISKNDLICPEDYTTSILEPFDSISYDINNYDASLFLPIEKDYITISRGSINKNAWSRSNRWFHSQVINATASYNNDPSIITTYGSKNNKAVRPILEFYSNLKLFNLGTAGKGFVDFLDTRTTDAFTQVMEQVCYYPDVQVYTGYDATITGVVSGTSTTITLPASSVQGTLAVNQYINDSAGLLPTDATITAISGTTTLTLTVEWNALKTFSTTGNLSLVADDSPNTNYQVFDGAKIIFANDNNPNVANKIYVVNFSTLSVGSTPVITLTEAPNGNLLIDQQFVVTRGYNSTGKTYYYNGEYVAGQQKISVNQAPLFDVLDENGISFGDQSVYTSSSFAGNKLFAYGIGVGTDDVVLGFPLRFSSAGTLGDISFDVSFNKDTFDYVSDTSPITQKINAGYVYNYSSRTDYTRELGWKTAIGESVQYQIFEFDYNATNPVSSYTCDVAVLTSAESPWPTIFVYVNNEIVSKELYTVTSTSNTTTVSYALNSPVNTKIQILLLSNQASRTAYYGIPINLSNNPFNGNLAEVNVGDIRGQYKSIFYNNPNSSGNAFGSNNYRDLGITVPYGNVIIQNSASLVLPGTFLRKKNDYIFDALLFNSREYIKYKSLLVATVNSLALDQTFNGANVLDAAVDQITAAKSQEQPFFWSDMLPAKAPVTINSYLFNNYLDQAIFPLTKIYDFSSASYYGLMVYVARTDSVTGITTTKLLIKGVDYTVTADAPTVIVTYDLQLNDIVTVNEYSQTYGSYVPNTPTKLGLYPSFVPKVVYDDTFVTPTWFIRGHDGSYNKLYGDYNPTLGLIDFRDQALFEFECRIYNNLKLSNNIPILENEILPGFFRTTDYTYDEFLRTYSPAFLNWVGENRINYQRQYFSTFNEFTYNYSDTKSKIDTQLLTIGGWRGLYEYFYDTASPNSSPWEMLGYTDKPDWWESRYGAAPYTSDNLVLWQDLEQGIDWNNGNPVIIPEAVRPGLTSVIPVGESGEILSPLRTIIGSYNPNIFQRDWKVGDVGPAEYSYRRSSSYPFDLMRLFALMKPAKFFNLSVDLDNYKYNAEFNQYLVNNRSHLVISDIEIYGSGTPKTSYINWVVDYEKQAGVDATTNLTNTLDNLDVRLVYRMAGYSDKNMLQFYVEKSSANDLNSSLLIPDESYGILLYDNQPNSKIIYSPVIIQVTGEGFSVFGNSQLTAYFKTLSPVYDGNYTNITVESASVKITDNYGPSEQLIPYGTVFYSTQELAQFLMNYGKYLESQGMIFDQIVQSYTVDWELMIREFLYWSQLGWEIGNVITLNPAALALVINKEDQIVQPLTIQDTNFVLNQNLYPIKSSDISVIRDETFFSLEPLNKLDTIAYGQFNLSNFEHGIVFDNITVFDDIIYNLITGLKQDRIFVRGTKSAEWNGTITASGFIYNQDNIKEWSQQVKYTKGSIVLYKTKYWVALTIVQPGNNFNEKEWKVTEYSEIQKGLLPNSSTRSYETALYYDVYKANLENDADLLSFSLIGYRPRDYLAVADLTDITQINVYKNMIKSKGTRASLSTFKGAQLPQGGINYEVYENWAIKTGDFGGVLNNNFAEFKLSQNLLTGNPGIVSLKGNTNEIGVQQEVPLSSLFNYSRPITSPDILPILSDPSPRSLYPNAGYVNFNDVKMSSFFYSQANEAVDINGLPVSLTEFYVRDYYWVANYKSNWQVFTPESIGQILNVSSNLNGTATITFENDHNLSKYDPFAIVNFNSAINGYYTVDTVINTKQVLITLEVNTNNRSITGYGLAYKFTSQRVVSPADIINLPLINAEFVKNTVWVDENIDGDWAVYRKSLNYQYKTQLTNTNSSFYGAAVAYTNDAGYLVSDPNLGELYRYTYNDLLQDYILQQTLTSGASFGTNIIHKNNIYVVSEPTGTPKVHIYVKNPTLLTDNLVAYQSAITALGGSTEWGSKVALSGDTKWLYISDDVGQKVYVYRKQDFSVNSGYFVIGETYTITSVGTTDFTLLGAIENKVGITFIATGSGDTNATGVAQQGTYKYSTVIDGLSLGEEFGASLATDYYGDTLVVGAPKYDASTTAANSGIAYVYSRSVQNIEVQSTGSGQTFTLAWTPTAPTTVTTLGTSSINGVNCSINMSGFNVNDTVIFTPTSSISDFDGTNIVPNTTYYIQSIGSNWIQLKQSRSTNEVYYLLDSVKNLNVYVQVNPLYVTVNGILVDSVNYAYVGNTFYYNGLLNAGDIINVSDNQFILAQTLELPDSARTGVQFGYDLDVTTQASEILVGAPFALDSTTNQEGAVYRWTNGGGKFGVITGTQEVAVTTTRNLLLNGYLVTLAPAIGGTLSASDVSQLINAAGITNILASASDNILTIQVTNTDIAVINEKLLISAVDSNTLTELGLELFTQTQTILCPHLVGPTQFGKTIKFNEYDSVVISAPVGTRYTATTFDFVDDENFTNDTLFDNNATQFIDSYTNAGAVYMFDYLGVYNETISDLGQFVYAQSINSPNQEYGNSPMYGYSVDFYDWTIIAGAPEYRIDTLTGCELTLGNAGQVTIFNNPTGIKDWSTYRTPSATVDVSGIENVQIFSAETNNTLINLDYIDPLQGKILGAVRQNIDVVSNNDPAGYNTGLDINGNLVWGEAQVGTIWFDTTSIRYVNYHQNDITYNSKYWGTLFPGSTVAVYSWVASTVAPSSYQGPGTPYNSTTYSVQATINSSNAVVPIYYFWVRNTGIVFTKRGKTLADTILELYISNPKSSGIAYMAALLPNTFGLYNAQDYINATDSVLHIGFKSSNNIDVGHSEYALIRANYADDFLPGIPELITTDHLRAIHGAATYSPAPPESLYDRLLDSMAGVDETGAVVPNPLLPKAVQSGILARPRQSFFFNRLTALKNYIQYANEVLAQYPITEIRPGATYLFAQNPITYNNTVSATNMIAGEQYIIISTGTTDFTQFGSGSNIIGTLFTATGPATGSGTVDVIVGPASYTASDIVSGSTYIIETLGNTDFTAIGASSNTVGIEFTATGTSSGTGTVNEVLFDVGEEYDTSNFWDYVTWWAEGYDDATKPTVQVPVYASLSTLSVSNGTIASVLSNGSGKTEYYRYNSTTNSWFRIGLAAGTIQIKSSLYDYMSSKFGFGDNFYDTSVYDLFPSEETRYIIRALNEQIYTNDLLIHRNRSLILMFEYIQSETIESQNMLPWLNKTSLVDVTHTIRELVPLEVFRSDNQVFLSGYLNEVKPYHVLIKEFLFKYTGIDEYQGDITDFDLPAQYNTNVNQFITPQLVYSSPKGDDQFLPDDAVWQEINYNQWFTNYGLSLSGINNFTISRLVSYMDSVSNSIIVDNIWGFPITGTITIGTEEIVYNSVDRDLGILYNLQRGANNTTVAQHLPNETIYCNLPPVVVLDGGRGYTNPPRVVAYIDTTIYPAPTVEAVLEPVMYLDSVLSINVIDPGKGYATTPDIIIDAAQSVVFTSADVDVMSNTFRLFAPTLQTGDMVRYEVGTGTDIGGLVDQQWYYVAVLETVPAYVVAFYDNYSNAINDHDRVEIYTQGTGSHTINMGARATAITQSSPVRENITTLRFDRTTYESQITTWTANSLYAAPFIGDYYTSEAFSSSTIQVYSSQPAVQAIPASANGFVLQIEEVANDEQTHWSTFTRYFAQSWSSESGNAYVIGLAPTGGSLTNASGSTVGFAIDMPIKFVPITISSEALLGSANIQANTTYYIAEVLNDTQFKMKDSAGNIVEVTTYNPANTAVEIYTAQVVDTAILTVNYPGIRTATNTTNMMSNLANTTGYGIITMPITEVGTGGTSGMYTGLPVYFIGNVFGGLIENEIYYVTSVIDNERFTVSESQEPLTIQVIGTTSITNIVTVSDSSGLAAEIPIVFEGETTFGNLQFNTIYYVTQVLNDTQIIISEVLNGTSLVLATATGSINLVSQGNTVPLQTTSGSMTVNIALPVSPGQVNGQQFTLYPTSNNYPNITTYTVGNLISVSATATLGAVDRVILEDITNLYVNMPVEVDTAVGGLSTLTTYYITDLDQVTANVTGTYAVGNLVICDSTSSLYVDMPVTFTGNTAISNIVITQQYYVESIFSSTEFSISETIGGTQVSLATASGALTVNGLYYTQLSLTQGGSPEVLFTATTDFIVNQTPTVLPTFNISWILGGYRVIITDPGEGFAEDNLITINGSYVGGDSTNNISLYVNTIDTLGEITDVIVSGIVPSYSNTYYLKALTSNTMAVYSDPLMQVPVSGIDFAYDGFTASTATINSANIEIANHTLFAVNDSVVFTSMTNSGDIVEGNTYFIITLDPITGVAELSELPGGTLFSPNGSGTATIAKAGSYAFLPEPFYFRQSIVKYNNSLYGCIVSNGDPDFVYGKWELLQSSDRRLNALDRIVGYYQPTDDMPGKDLTQLVTNIVYPNSTYYGNPFEPSQQWPLDTQLIDEPFYPTNVNLAAITNNGNIFLAPVNLPEYSGIAKDDLAEEWDLYKLSEQPLDITDIAYSSNTYLMTSTNTSTPIFKSDDGINWSTVGYYSTDASLPWSNSTTGLTLLNSANLSLNTVAYDGNLWIAAGNGNIVSSNDVNIWRETYTSNAALQYELFGSTDLTSYLSAGFVAVGSGLTANASGNLVSSGVIVYSADGIVWQDSTLVTDKTLYSAAASSSIIVAVGEDGAIFTSINGINWIGVRETLAVSTNSVNQVLNVAYTDNFSVNDSVRVNNAFDVLVTSTTYYVANVVSSTQLILSPDSSNTVATSLVASTLYQITDLGTTDFTLVGAASNTVGVIFTASASGAGTGTARRLVNFTTTTLTPDRTFLYRTPVLDTLRDVHWNGSRFMTVGDGGTIRTSINGNTWFTRTSGTTENLTGITYKSPYWVAVGENNTVLRSTGTGVTWEAISSFAVAQPAYNVQGDPFLYGYGPEELVPGVVSDSLAMTVTTRPGITWEATEYAHSGYNVVSLELQATSATDNIFFFADAVSVPAQLSCFIIDATSGLSTSIYETIDNFTVDWVNKRIVFSASNPLNYTSVSSPGNTLRIDVYEVGNGNQLEKSCTDNDPIRYNTTTGFDEIYLNCNYTAEIWQGSGVVQNNTYPIEVNAYATDSVTNQIYLDSVSNLVQNTPISFTGGVFGNIQEDVVYYVKSISEATNSITVSLTYNVVTGLAGATFVVTTATGSMTCVISYGNGTVYTDPIVYHNGNKLVLGKTNSVTRTKSATNAITCNTTSGLIVDTPIVFSDTIFGGISAHVIYYISSIVDLNEFTISTTMGGAAVSLTNAAGSATFVTNDYAYALAPNGVSAKIVFAPQTITAGSFVIGNDYVIQSIGSTDFTLVGATSNTIGTAFTATGVGSGTGTATTTYDTSYDFISYAVLGETSPTQYGYTLPQTQVFTYSGSTVFALDNYIASNWEDASIVEVNGIRIPISNYTIDPIGDTINFISTYVAAPAIISGLSYQIATIGTTDFTLIGASGNTAGVIFTATGAGTGTGVAEFILNTGDTIAVTLFNDTYKEYFDTTYGLTGSVGAVSGLIVGTTTHTEISYDELATAGSFIIGQEYVIDSIGTTDFTLIGAASNTVGISFVATGAGTGSGTAAVGYDDGDYDETYNWLTLSAGTTASLAVNDAITFTAPTIGGIVSGTTYYVVEIWNSTEFVISETIGGGPFVVYDDSGSMAFDISPIRVNNILTISNTISAPVLSTYVTNTTTVTNRLTVSSTTGMSVDDTIIFKGTGFGGVLTDGTVYFIESVISATQFRIKDESGSLIPLSTAAGSMLADVGGQPAVRVTTGITHNFTENDLIIIDGTLGSIQLNGNTYYAKIITSYIFDLYEQPYDPGLFAVNYPITYCSTYTGSGYVWLSGLFRLRNTYATATNSVSDYITVADTSELIEDTPVYFTKPGVALGTAILGGLIAGQKYYIREVVSATQITISTEWGGDSLPLTTDTESVYVTQWEQTDVDRLWVTVNGLRVPSSSLRLLPANELGILTTIGTGDVVIVTSMMPSATPNEQVYINFVNQENSGYVYRANSNTKTWLTQNLDLLDTVIHVDDVTKLTNYVAQTSTTPAAVNDVYTVGINADRTEILSIAVLNTSQSIAADAIVTGQTYKITAIGSTDFTLIGALENEVGTIFIATGVGTGTGYCNPYIDPVNFTRGIVDVAPVIFIDSGSWITAGDELVITTTVGKDIMINGEIIRIYAVDTLTNTITSFVRGANGSAVQATQPIYSEIFSLLNDNRMISAVYAETWNSDIYNTVLGDPLQISETTGAVFLNADIT